MSRRSIFYTVRDEYIIYALRIAGKYLPHTDVNLDNLYDDVHLILWGADVILRSDFAPLTQLIVEVSNIKNIFYILFFTLIFFNFNFILFLIKYFLMFNLIVCFIFN